jgi:hypothetical protein
MVEEDVHQKQINNSLIIINIYMMAKFHMDQYGLYLDLLSKHLICGGSPMYHNLLQ